MFPAFRVARSRRLFLRSAGESAVSCEAISVRRAGGGGGPSRRAVRDAVILFAGGWSCVGVAVRDGEGDAEVDADADAEEDAVAEAFRYMMGLPVGVSLGVGILNKDGKIDSEIVPVGVIDNDDDADEEDDAETDLDDEAETDLDDEAETDLDDEAETDLVLVSVGMFDDVIDADNDVVIEAVRDCDGVFEEDGLFEGDADDDGDRDGDWDDDCD